MTGPDLVKWWRQMRGSIDPQFVAWLREQTNPLGDLTSDGWRYLALAERPVPRPYNYRWLLPKLNGTDRVRWAATTNASLVAMVPAMRWYTGRWAPGLFMFGLNGVWQLNRRYPVLVDAPAMTLAILAAGAVRHRRWELAVALSLAAGSAKEAAPIFAALYAGNPLPLIGLISPAIRHRQPEGPDVTDDFSHECVIHPFASAWQVRRDNPTDPKLWVAPWGALVLGLARPTVRTAATLVAAYAQCVRSVDSARLYEWAWPVLAENTVEATGDWWGVALLAHLLNPWKGNGG